MRTGVRLIVPCTLGCGTGVVGMWVGACTLSYGVGTGDRFSVAVGGMGVSFGMGAGRVVA